MKVKGSLNSIENPLHHLADIPAGSQTGAKHEDGLSDSRRNSLRLRLPTCLCFQTIFKINMNCLIPAKLSLKQKISLRKRHLKSLNLIYFYRFWPQHQKWNMKKFHFPDPDQGENHSNTSPHLQPIQWNWFTLTLCVSLTTSIFCSVLGLFCVFGHGYIGVADAKLLYCHALHSTALHCITLNWIALYWTLRNLTALHYDERYFSVLKNETSLSAFLLPESTHSWPEPSVLWCCFFRKPAQP